MYLLTLDNKQNLYQVFIERITDEVLLAETT